MYLMIRIVAIIFLITLTQRSLAQEDAVTAPVPCSDCHLETTLAWEGSSHALAYHDPWFQTAWYEVRLDVTCLACHTTGFVPRTGTYQHEGVTCSACHGDTPTNHPPETIVSDPGSEVCADCHLTTVAEWERSLHHSEDITCSSCHNPHPQQLKAESSQALCLSCHESDETSSLYIHTKHPDNTCTECHWYHSAEDETHRLTGALAASGHDSAVMVRSCNDCHAELDPTWQTVSQTTLSDPHASTTTTQAPANMDIFNLVQGVLLGVFFGGSAVAILLSLRRRNHQP